MGTAIPSIGYDIQAIVYEAHGAAVLAHEAASTSLCSLCLMSRDVS